ncbi:GNAT family N-acetyltransferase [uncultured Paenibacillus sp.]|uniref:GNAT family N-acetyltransferase n=1 Tax=uncultured Paenibacillus sp. TaxID=227322 RepID=UPI0015A99394|nr:GNAT family N-acetyltransferase [uncultured Paenibacillus sp.]
MHPSWTWADVEALQRLVEQHDGIALKLNWDTLHARKEESASDLVELREGRLVAFLGLYPFGSTLEVCGMVHPDYRRQGLFTSLLRRGLNSATVVSYSTILLNAPGNSELAKQFLATYPCRFDFSEYQMKYAAEAASADLSSIAIQATLRQAEEADRPLLSRLDQEGFGLTAEDTRQFYEALNEDEIRQNELILHEGEAVGKIRVSRRDQEAWIYGFVVSSSRRGQGIGGKALRQVVYREQAAGYNVWLEVALNNPQAKKLYEQAGFRVCRSQDYYAYLR